jgi:hypothetical protein
MPAPRGLFNRFVTTQASDNESDDKRPSLPQSPTFAPADNSEAGDYDENGDDNLPFVPEPDGDKHKLSDGVAIADSFLRSSRIDDEDQIMTEVTDEEADEAAGDTGTGEEAIDDARNTVDDNAPAFDEDEQDDTSRKSHTMPPNTPDPLRRASHAGEDPTTEVPCHPQPFSMSFFFLALAIFIDKWKVSREMYQDLRTVLNLLQPAPVEITTLPKRVDTVKRALNDQLPLLKQRERELKLDPTMVPTRSSHTDNICLFDMEDVLRRMAHSTMIKSQGHFGMANIVDDPSEFWESESWGVSNRTTSGEFAMVRGGSAAPHPVLGSEFVWFYDDEDKQRLGRVLFVGWDYTADASAKGVEGEVTLLINYVYAPGALPERLQQTAMSASLTISTPLQELFLIENETPMKVKERQIRKQEPSVFLDYRFGTDQPHPQHPQHKFIIRHIFTKSVPPTLRKLVLSAPPRGELEIEHYTRDEILGRLSSTTHTILSLPYTAFIDGFGLYRNMHRSIIGKYLQWSFMNKVDRKRQINVFPLTLGPFGASWEDVVKLLVHLSGLELGVDVTLDDGTKVTICAPCLACVGDMPQQQANAGCKSQNAEFFCRFCLIGSARKGDLKYDIVSNARYHNEMVRVRAYAETLSQNKKLALFQQFGLSKDPSWLYLLTPALDRLRSCPPDAAHSEFKGIARQIITCLFDDVLKPSFHEAFAQQFAALPTPPGWPRNSHIKRHFGSYSMQEFGRASIMLPVVLRKWLSPIHLRKRYLEAINAILDAREDNTGHEGINFLVHCFSMIAKSNALFVAPILHKADRKWVQSIGIESRERYQDILGFAVHAAGKGIAPPAAVVGNPHSRFSPAGRRGSMDSEASNVTETQLDDTMFGEEEEASDAQLTLKASEKAGVRKVALERKRQTPNVHSILHFYDIVIQYASSLNVLTFQGEDRHR